MPSAQIYRCDACGIRLSAQAFRRDSEGGYSNRCRSCRRARRWGPNPLPHDVLTAAEVARLILTAIEAGWGDYDGIQQALREAAARRLAGDPGYLDGPTPSAAAVAA